MSDQPEKPAKRGEAAWIAARDEISGRNAATRKAGKAEREVRERDAAARRRADELRRSAELNRSVRG